MISYRRQLASLHIRNASIAARMSCTLWL